MNMNINVKKVLISFTVPKENANEVKSAICKVGAGIIGNYNYCTISSNCIGSFIPNNNANPYIGKTNEIQYVEEEKIETVCDAENVKKVVSKLREVHPYEEPAILIIPLLDV